MISGSLGNDLLFGPSSPHTYVFGESPHTKGLPPLQIAVGFRAPWREPAGEGLRKLQPPATDLLYVNHAGRQQAVMPVEAQQAMLGEETLALLRGGLETTLFQALREGGDGGSGNGVDIRFATTVADIGQDADRVTVTLSDGRQERVDLLVGADGLHSAVRDLVFGPEQAYRVDFGHAVATYLLDKTPDGVAPAARFRWTWLGVASASTPFATGGRRRSSPSAVTSWTLTCGQAQDSATCLR